MKFKALLAGFGLGIIALVVMAQTIPDTVYRGHFLGYSTNLANFGIFQNVGTNNADGVIQVADPSGLVIAGFDTNLFGFWTASPYGFVDGSGTPGGVVAYQGGGRLGSTNRFVGTHVGDGSAVTNIPNAGLNNSSVTVNGTAGQISTTAASIALGGSATLSLSNPNTQNNTFSGNNVFSGNNSQTGSNYIAGAQGIYTNANNTTPDFNVLSSTLKTNANFTWLAPVNLDTSGKVEQWIITHVTNSSGSLITMTAPANVHVCGGGAFNCTNWTEVRWQYVPPSGPTNAWSSPGY